MRARRVIGALAALVVLVGGGLFAGGRLSRSAAEEVATRLYQCPMHPQIVAREPGVCPICQMPLKEVDAPSTVTVPGHAPFTLSAERQQLIGVTSAVVERRPLEVEIRTVGTVAYDPGLYQAVVEYREALRSQGQMKGTGADALVRAAALKLRQQGIDGSQLRELAKEGRDPVNLLLPDTTMWVYAQVYEYEVELVRAGQEMVLTAVSLPGRTFHATVAGVDPILDAKTRTARVRALVPTPEASLRPETWVSVQLLVPLGEKTALPVDAVLDTGEHRIVFVVGDEGRFVPREVELGHQARGYYEVIAGVEPGERVVTSANFLIDSESRFRAALAASGGKAPASGHHH